MGKIISVVNQKGGVGKTTTAVNLSSALASLGKYVLLVDIDPQANASSGLGISNIDFGIYEAIIGKKNITEIIRKTKQKNFDLAPSSASLAGAGIELVEMEEREWRLSTVLNKVKNEYDYIIIDGPPSLGLLTINNLVAGDEILIPIQSEYYALEGLGQLLETIELIGENLRPEIKIMGAVITMFDKRNRLSGLVKKELKEHFPGFLFNTVIPRNIRLAEAPSYGRTISQYDKNSTGSLAYTKLAKEVIKIST